MPNSGRYRPEQHRRLKFIDEELFWRGEITRARIMTAFDVHLDTAKYDLRTYRRDFAPDLRVTGPDRKYRVGEDFKPRIEPRPVAEDYLWRLAGYRGEDLPSLNSGDLEVDSTPLLARRPIEPIVLQGLIRSLVARQEIYVLYRSPSRQEAKAVWILPEGFLHDGFRWSCRCYRYDIEGWGEAVLDRIEDDLSERRPADPGKLRQDGGWTERVVLHLAPNPGLEPSQAAAIASQYNIKGRSLEITLRRCQVAYFLKRYQLEEPITLKAAHQAPLVLINRSEAMAAIPPGMRVPLPDWPSGAAGLMAQARVALPALTEQEIMEHALVRLLGPASGPQD